MIISQSQSLKFGGVRLGHSYPLLQPGPYGKEEWHASLVKENNPKVASDELVFSTQDSRSSNAPSWITITLQSPRIEEELTKPYSEGRLAPSDFPTRLKSILEGGEYRVKKASYVASYYGGPGRESRSEGDYDAKTGLRKFNHFMPSVLDALRRMIGGEPPKELDDVVTVERKKFGGFYGLINREKEQVETYRDKRLFISGKANVRLSMPWDY